MMEYILSTADGPIGTLETLTVSPGMALVIYLPGIATAAEIAKLREDMKQFFSRYPHWSEVPLLIGANGLCVRVEETS